MGQLTNPGLSEKINEAL